MIHKIASMKYKRRGTKVVSKVSGIVYSIGLITDKAVYLVNINGTPDNNKLYLFVTARTHNDLIKNFLI